MQGFRESPSPQRKIDASSQEAGPRCLPYPPERKIQTWKNQHNNKKDAEVLRKNRQKEHLIPTHRPHKSSRADPDNRARTILSQAGATEAPRIP